LTGVYYFSGLETIEKESVLDTISTLGPHEVPLIRSLPHKSMDSRILEAPVDQFFTSADNVRLPGAPHTNTRLEGADFVEDVKSYETRLRAIAEINHFTTTISNSDAVARKYGVTNNVDWRAERLYVKLLNNIENVLMYGVGSPETSGEDTVGNTDERMTQGLVHWSAWTGLERMHGSGLSGMNDPYGVRIPSEFFSTFYNAAGANLSRSMLFNKLLAPFARAGGEVDGLQFHVGYKLKNLIADFGFTPAGSAVNERTVAAESLMTYDSIDWIRVPMGGVVGFRTNRYLDLEGSSFTVNNQVYTPGTPTTPGSVGSITFQADETIIGYMPGYAEIGWYRTPQYQELSRSGDYRRIMAVAEFAFLCRNPLALVGAGNCLS
jgi:hypothetical protein